MSQAPSNANEPGDVTGADSANSVTSVVVTEQDVFARAGLSHLLEQAGIRVSGECRHPDQIRQLCRELPTSVLVLAGLPAESTLSEVVRNLREGGVDSDIVALLDGREDGDIPYLIDQGVKGLVDRDEDPCRLVEAIRSIGIDSRVWISPGVAIKLLPTRRNDLDRPQLTGRERDMLFRAAHGQSNEVIAGELNISTGTVRNHFSTIYAKLEVHSRAEAVAWAWLTGLAQSKGSGRLDRV